jgi:DNA-directed RNA polymerase subunit alpha
MIDTTIVLPSKPKVVSENDTRGVYETEGLYPGYGHTLGNSLRRIILSSLPGTAITSLKIDGASHEFSTLAGVKEDVVMLILNLKKIIFRLHGEEPIKVKLQVKGKKTVTAKDIEAGSQIEILNPELYLATITDDKVSLDIEMTVEKGLGYLPKEALQKDNKDIGVIFIDAVFTPIKRVSYEVENMRVGDRTDYNRLRMMIETNGTIAPRESLEKAIEVMVAQLQAMVGFKESGSDEREVSSSEKADTKSDSDSAKIKIEDWTLSGRVANALMEAGIKTVGGLIRKKEEDLGEVDGLGEKGIQEIIKELAALGLTLKPAND